MANFLLMLLTSVVGQPNVQTLFFTSQSCQPCAQMKPTMEALGREGWQIHEVQVENRPEIVQQFQIKNLPTVVLLSGEREIDRIVGVTPKSVLEKRLARVAARSGRPHQPPSNHPKQPVVRGQSPQLGSLAGQTAPAALIGMHNQGSISTPTIDVDPGPAAAELTIEQAIARAEAATVRIRVDEGNTTAHGTGTVIDVHGPDALVLTCGHLFRDMQSGTVLSVDLFAGTPRETQVAAQLIDFRADQEDIGLITFRLPTAIEPVVLLPQGERVSVGQPAFSFGCDHGANPSRRDTRITHVDRYLGSSNIEISGAPAVGRSGGGLFDTHGRLIGVCNAANADEDEGIYAANDVIYQQIERLGLGHLFAPAPSPSGRDTPRMQLASSSEVPASINADHSHNDQSAPWPDNLGNTNAQPGRSTSPLSSTSSSKVICIVQDANGASRMVTIDRPTPTLMREIDSAGSVNAR